MSIHQLANGNGIFNPADLTLMQDVLDQACARNGVVDEEGRATVGRKLLILFQGGVRDRDLLLETLCMSRSKPRSSKIV